MAAKAKSKSKQGEQAAKDGEKNGRPRIHTLDELRGLAIFCMVFFHAFYSIGYFFDYEWGRILVNFFQPAEPFFAGLFVLLSGIACNLSHSNLERGVKLALISLGVTLVSFLALGQSNMIQFGILHMLASCMLLYGLCNKYLKLIPSVIGIVINLLLFWFTWSITARAVGFPPFMSWSVPDSWYSTRFLFMLGFPYEGFSSSDYFPLLPWLFLFFAGTYLGRIGIKHKFPKFLFKKRISFFAFLGRHSLLIYLAHQPVIFGLCYAYIGISSWFH